MIRILEKLFISKKEGADRRQAYGVLCGAVGILLNICLFTGKFLAGVISNSIAITADAFNSFPFFTKYVVIAAFVAMLLPFCVELVKKYFSITVETGVDGEKGRNNKKNN